MAHLHDKTLQRMLRAVGMAICMMLMGVWHGVSAALPNIHNVQGVTTVFNPTQGEMAALDYELGSPAEVTATIYDALCRPIRTLSPETQQAGKQQITWDGRDDAGAIVPNEAYTWGLTASADDSSTTIHFLASGGETLEAQDRHFDSQSGLFTYTLERPARVRLRLGIRGGALLRVLDDWTPHPAGEQTTPWDGMDTDGVINVMTHPDLAYDLQAFALPENVVITTGNPAQTAFLDLPDETAECPLLTGADLHRHAQEARNLGHAPHFQISLPTGEIRPSDGLPAVQGTVPLQITIDEVDFPLLARGRFEMLVYVDGAFLYEIEQGVTPYVYMWDTTGLNAGEHIVTVNVHVTGGHINAHSIRLWVEA